MEEIIKSENSHMDLTSPIFDEVSPYSAAYPVELLSNGLKLKLAQAGNIAENVYRAVAKASPIAAQVREATKKGYKFVVDATESTLDAIESGKS